MTTVIEPSERINVVHIDGLVSLKKINFFLLKHTLFFYLDLKKTKKTHSKRCICPLTIQYRLC